MSVDVGADARRVDGPEGERRRGLGEGRRAGRDVVGDRAADVRSAVVQLEGGRRADDRGRVDVLGEGGGHDSARGTSMAAFIGLVLRTVGLRRQGREAPDLVASLLVRAEYVILHSRDPVAVDDHRVGRAPGEGGEGVKVAVMVPSNVTVPGTSLAPLKSLKFAVVIVEAFMFLEKVAIRVVLRETSTAPLPGHDRGDDGRRRGRLLDDQRDISDARDGRGSGDIAVLRYTRVPMEHTRSPRPGTSSS